MLPFPKRSALHGEAIELDDDDLVVIEDAPVRASLGDAGVREILPPREATRAHASRISTRLPTVRPPPISSRSMVRAAPASSRPRNTPVDMMLEDEVIDECISSISVAVAGHGSQRAARRADPVFVDDQAITAREAELYAPARRAPRSLPPASSPAFVRRSQPGAWAAREPEQPQSHLSVAPVAVPARSEPTVIVVKQKPRSIFVLASAAVGALAAVLAMRLTTADAHRPAPLGPAVAAAVAQPPAAAVAVPTVAAPAAEPKPAAPKPEEPAAAAPSPPKTTVVSFKDDQGVAIKVPVGAALPRAGSGAPHAAKAPHKPAVKRKPAQSGPPPLLPDGPSGRPAGLGAKLASEAPDPPKKASPPRHHPLSAAEKLAEEQLRAALR